MAFILEQTLDGAATVVTNVPLTDSEASTYGEALVMTTGAATKCGATTVPTKIAAQSVTAGTGKTVDVVNVRKDAIYLADYVGTGTLLKGTKYALDATGLKVDTDVTTNGVAELYEVVDTTKKKIRVIF